MFSGPKWFQIAIGAAAGFALCWLIHLVIMGYTERAHAKALVEQEEKLHAECAADKAITKGVADDLQNKTAVLNRRIGELKRLHASAACIVPAPGTTVGSDATPGGAVPAGAHGVTADALYDFAGEAEGYRLRLISCQDFIVRTWRAKGQ